MEWYSEEQVDKSTIDCNSALARVRVKLKGHLLWEPGYEDYEYLRHLIACM